MSYDMYRSLPEGTGYDLLGGLCFREPMPTVSHQMVMRNILELLRRHARIGRSGVVLPEIDVHLDGENAPAPDVCFVSRDRARHLDNRGLHGIAPDLCVEVLSPSTAHRARGEKAQLYGRFGCREYWLVDCEHLRVEVLRPGSDGTFAPFGAFGKAEAFGSLAVVGLHVDVAEVFAEY